MNNNSLTIEEKSKEYELQLDEQYRKNKGIFYTSVKLASKMIDELDLPSESSIIDPCCGTGIFLNAAEKKGYKSLFGIDIDAGALQIANTMLNKAKLFKFDSLTNTSDRIIERIKHDGKFDCIIGNPPYVAIDNNNFKINIDKEKLKEIKESGNNLFIVALLQALELVRDGGIVSYIIPKNFLHVSLYKKTRNIILYNKTILEIIDIGTYFKNVRGEQIILTLKNEKPKDGSKIRIKKLTGESFELMSLIPQSFYKDEILLFNSYQDYMIYKKFDKVQNKFSDLKSVRIRRGNSTHSTAVKGRDIRKFGFKDKKLPNQGNQLFMQNIYSAESGSIATFGGNLEASQTVTVLSMNNMENCKLYLGILLSKICNLFLYKYCFNSSKLTMHTDSKYLMKIPIPDSMQLKKYYNDIINLVEMIEKEEYMSEKWLDLTHELDAVINKAYRMNKYEIKYMDLEMKKIRSSRW